MCKLKVTPVRKKGGTGNQLFWTKIVIYEVAARGFFSSILANIFFGIDKP